MGILNQPFLWIGVLGAITIALSIALGVVLARDGNQKSSSTAADPAASGGPPANADESRGVGLGGLDVGSEGGSSRAIFDIDLTPATLSCPAQEGSSQLFAVTDLSDPSAVQISKSTAGMLCTLVRVINPSDDGARENTFVQPIGRSYSGYDWETTRGKFLQETSFACGDSACTINLNLLEAAHGAGKYQLSTFLDPAQYTTKDVAARFLEQATFGSDQAGIDALASLESGRDAFKTSAALDAWVTEQQDVTKTPIMSHRATFRQYVNARQELVGPIGRTTLPCDVGSRFRRYAFTEKDVGKDPKKKLQLETVDGTILFKVDGKVRTAFKPSSMFWLENEVITPLWYPDSAKYQVCKVTFDQYQGTSTVQIKEPTLNNNKCFIMVVQGSDGMYYSNPPIEIHPGANDPKFLIPNESAQLIDTEFPVQRLTDAPDNTPEGPQMILTAGVTDAICADLSTKKGYDNDGVIATWNGNNYIFDPRYHLLENTLEKPLADGGGPIIQQFGSLLGENHPVMCANVARNFVNEDTCYLSTDPNVCSSRPLKPGPVRAAALDFLGETSEFIPTPELLHNVYQTTGGGAEGTIYLYAIDGLDIKRDPNALPPCQQIKKSRSRWMKQTCSATAGQGLADKTLKHFQKFLPRFANKEKHNNNGYWFEVYVKPQCDAADEVKKGFEIPDKDDPTTCYLNVHPDTYKVYDFTPWVQAHPGNRDDWNPIANFHAVDKSGIIVFPESHRDDISRWYEAKNRLSSARLQLGKQWDFYKLPNGLREAEVAEGLGVGLTNQAVNSDGPDGPALVCGSPYEVPNNPMNGGNTRMGAFDVATQFGRTSPVGMFNHQKWSVWTMAAMTDKGQFRQRAAWALAQIFPIEPAAINQGRYTSENQLTYYDIFVRHAFGNYRDVLKEVSYSPLMATMLTFYGGRSTATVLEDEGNVEYADENYAREIMQLFTVGLYQLNQDGTPKVDSQQVPASVYSNDDIEEYARAWTGFVRQPRRGNIEDVKSTKNDKDPMQIVAFWRDRYPKMGLNRQYVGDGFPLCSDLPAQHFLSAGSKYQLIESATPDLLSDPFDWRGEAGVPLTLDASSQLYAKISGVAPQVKIILDQTLPCSGEECNVDSVRVVKVGDYFYEYVRAPCVNQAFYSNAKTVARRDGTHAMCADPQLESATAACCGDAEAWIEKFWGERMKFQTASDRCGGSLCGIDKQPACAGNQCLAKNNYWTSSACTLKAQIDVATGKVAIVHGPTGVVSEDAVAPIVRSSNAYTFFRVDWSGDFSQVLASCDALATCSLVDEECLCDVSVAEEQVFSGTAAPSRADILSSLSIGAVDPDPAAVLQGEDVVIYNAGADGSLTPDSIFAVLDGVGRKVLRKNTKSTVNVVDGLSFRNPVHFMSLNDAEPRDAHQETDATLDHYFYHENLAPFVAYRFAQRFGVSNPSPRYTEVIANAFTTGSYTSQNGASYGTGQYGDLAATFAAVLLDREARDFVLDGDPSFGAFKEPLIKLVGMMKALNFKLNDIFKWVEFHPSTDDYIGQMAFSFPSIFSFFRPEYQASGPVVQAGLVAPEAQVLSGPTMINTMNGILSLLKYGLSQCFSGLGPWGTNKLCKQAEIGSKLAVGGTDYTQPLTAVDAVSDLATLMTAGRLSTQTRSLVEAQFNAVPDENSAIRAQMLISATPEFHTTGLSQPSGGARAEAPAKTFSDKPYKALVYLMLHGGADSWNILAPNTCSATNPAGKTLVEQYNFERSTIALTEDERSERVIAAAGQPCEEFSIHPKLEVLERLYNDGDLAFFPNAGQLDTPVTKDNYNANTRSRLFAHNHMRDEGRKLDPWDTNAGTGILGRTCDALKAKGYNPQSLSVHANTMATAGAPGAGVVPLVVSIGGPAEFAKVKKSDQIDMEDHVASMTNATQLHSSVFGETWSKNFKRAVEDTGLLYESFDRIELTQDYGDDPDYGRQVKTAKMMSSLILSRLDRGNDRDVLYAEYGGWDTHAAMKEATDFRFQGLNMMLGLFESEMKAQGLWDQVTLMIGSDFGRTLTPNSQEGSDHAWGGHYFMMGGSVKGGQILGQYPPDISADGPVNLGRGRVMPTQSWESIYSGPLQWMGLDTEADLDYAMPNRLNNGSPMYTLEQTFEQTGARRSLRHNNNNNDP